MKFDDLSALVPVPRTYHAHLDGPKGRPLHARKVAAAVGHQVHPELAEALEKVATAGEVPPIAETHHTLERARREWAMHQLWRQARCPTPGTPGFRVRQMVARATVPPDQSWWRTGRVVRFDFSRYVDAGKVAKLRSDLEHACRLAGLELVGEDTWLCRPLIRTSSPDWYFVRLYQAACGLWDVPLWATVLARVALRHDVHVGPLPRSNEPSNANLRAVREFGYDWNRGTPAGEALAEVGTYVFTVDAPATLGITLPDEEVEVLREATVDSRFIVLDSWGEGEE